MFDGISTIMPIHIGALGPTTVRDLLRAAGSVLSQECEFPSELLMVDDGSTPAMQSIPALEPVLADPRVRVVRLPRNQGLVYALNAGLTQARHGLIARIDGDDFWRPGKLRRQLEMFAADPELTLAGTSLRVVHTNDPSLDRDDLRGGCWNDVLAFVERVGCPFPHGSILARRDVFEILGGYPHSPVYTHCEDFALWSWWIRFFKVAIASEVLFEYTISEHQVSSRFAAEQGRASEMVRRTFVELGDYQRIPGAVHFLAEKLGLPLLSASRVLCRAWMFHEEIAVDADLYDAARIVFPDRAVHRHGAAEVSPGEQTFHLRCGA